MIVKVCGITRAEDALAAAEAGAGAIGFIFWPASPRYVEPQIARGIVARLPPFVTTVGVFVNQPAAAVNDAAGEAGVAAVQLHGDESPSYIGEMTLPSLKAVPVGKGFVPEMVDRWAPRTLVLLDVDDREARGGTGRTVDWSLAAAAARRRHVILAGGLNADNVIAAINAVRPFGIDVSSGIESRPGIKDHERLRALFKAIHALDSYAPRS